MKSYILKFFSLLAVAVFGGFTMATAEDGIEPIGGEAAPFVASASTTWSEIPGDLTVKEVVEGCGVKSAPDDYEEVKEAATSAKLTADRVLAVMTANENVWFEATNYYNQVGIPASMQLYETREGEKRKVWDQREWVRYYADAADAASAAALRGELSKWSSFQSVSGDANPLPDVTWISTPMVALSGGYEWQKNTLVSGDVYLLRSNGLAALSAPGEGSFFQVEDLAGEKLFSVKKTADQILDAAASAVNVDGSSLVIDYAVSSSDHPIVSVALYIDADRRVFYAEDDPLCPATVAWTGSSGAWRVTLTPKYVTNQLFAYAHYTKQGQTLVEVNGVTSSSKGFVCSDDPTKIVKIIWNNGNPKFVEVK